MEFVIESEVVSVVATYQRVVGPREICYREWSGVRCRDLPESSDRMVEARLGRLMEQTDSLSQQSKRGSDVFEVADESIVVRCLGH